MNHNTLAFILLTLSLLCWLAATWLYRRYILPDCGLSERELDCLHCHPRCAAPVADETPAGLQLSHPSVQVSASQCPSPRSQEPKDRV